jgi:hypothetical protein
MRSLNVSLCTDVCSLIGQDATSGALTERIDAESEVNNSPSADDGVVSLFDRKTFERMLFRLSLTMGFASDILKWPLQVRTGQSEAAERSTVFVFVNEASRYDKLVECGFDKAC